MSLFALAIPLARLNVDGSPDSATGIEAKVRFGLVEIEAIAAVIGMTERRIPSTARGPVTAVATRGGVSENGPVNHAGDVWSPPDLSRRVACVTGASYGVGRGIAEVLGMCGATVYVAARSTRSNPSRDPNWTTEETAALVDQHGGRGVPVSVDFGVEHDVHELFELINSDHGGLDLLVNSVWQWGPRESYFEPTTEQPVERWDAMFGIAARALFLAAKHAAPLLVQREGLIVATQERPGDAEHFADNIVVDAAAVAMKRMVEYLAHDLASVRVSSLMVYLGWVRTVNRGMGFDPAAVGWSTAQFEAATQSPHLVGRAVAHLAADRDVLNRSGATLYTGDVALEYGFTDIDGRVPDYDGNDLLAER